MFRLSAEPIITSLAAKNLCNPRAGAMVVFEGWVRNHHEGREVRHLEYEAYPALCVKEAFALEQEVFKNFDIIELSCIHRTGLCEIGAMAVWVGVTAEHRGPAYAASEFYMNQLKVRLPIWKKETYIQGHSEWVRCEACAEHAHEHQDHDSGKHHHPSGEHHRH